MLDSLRGHEARREVAGFLLLISDEQRHLLIDFSQNACLLRAKVICYYCCPVNLSALPIPELSAASLLIAVLHLLLLFKDTLNYSEFVIYRSSLVRIASCLHHISTINRSSF